MQLIDNTILFGFCRRASAELLKKSTCVPGVSILQPRSSNQHCDDLMPNSQPQSTCIAEVSGNSTYKTRSTNAVNTLASINSGRDEKNDLKQEITNPEKKPATNISSVANDKENIPCSVSLVSVPNELDKGKSPNEELNTKLFITRYTDERVLTSTKTITDISINSEKNKNNAKRIIEINDHDNKTSPSCQKRTMQELPEIIDNTETTCTRITVNDGSGCQVGYKMSTNTHRYYIIRQNLSRIKVSI